MVPGEYSICRVEVQHESDGLDYRTLSWGYDSLEQAQAALEGVAQDNEVSMDDLCIVRVWFAREVKAQPDHR